MFLSDSAKEWAAKDLHFFRKRGGTFLAAFQFWKENLFERTMRLFVWDNTAPVPAKEIEMRLILQGHCGLSIFRDPTGVSPEELTAFFGNFEGVSKYFDEKPNYVMRCPVWAGVGRIGEDVEVISNNSLRNPIMPLIERYALLLGHTEVTLVQTLVQARDAGGVPVASNEIQKRSIETYNNKLYNGENGVITDLAAIGVEYAGTDRHTQQKLVEIMEVRQKLLKSFYADIGVRASFEKRSNAVVEEVEADKSMLLLNIGDMLANRKEGCEKVNALFGTSFSVDLAPEIRYDENANSYEMEVAENETSNR